MAIKTAEKLLKVSGGIFFFILRVLIYGLQPLPKSELILILPGLSPKFPLDMTYLGSTHSYPIRKFAPYMVGPILTILNSSVVIILRELNSIRSLRVTSLSSVYNLFRNQEMKPSRNPLKQKLFENQLLVTTRNTQLVQKALNNLMEIAQVEVSLQI